MKIILKTIKADWNIYKYVNNSKWIFTNSNKIISNGSLKI